MMNLYFNPNISLFALSIVITRITIEYNKYLNIDDIPRILTNINNDSNSLILKVLDRIELIKYPFKTPFISSLLSGTMQTVLITIIRNVLSPFLITHKYDREFLVLKDGGTVAIDWINNNSNNDKDNINDNNNKSNNDTYNKTNNEKNNDNKSSVILILHGLCGHSYSEYVSYFVKELLANGYSNIACMIARGCGSIEMTTGEVYSAAQADDIRAVIKHGIIIIIISSLSYHYYNIIIVITIIIISKK